MDCLSHIQQTEFPQQKTAQMESYILLRFEITLCSIVFASSPISITDSYFYLNLLNLGCVDGQLIISSGNQSRANKSCNAALITRSLSGGSEQRTIFGRIYPTLHINIQENDFVCGTCLDNASVWVL